MTLIRPASLATFSQREKGATLILRRSAPSPSGRGSG
jgi:hypothetical protein